MAKKIVEVVKEVVVTYEVDGATDKDQAITIVKSRMAAGYELGILDTTEKVKKYRVKDG
jgi:hypothetical protein